MDVDQAAMAMATVEEVGFLMGLIGQHLMAEFDFYSIIRTANEMRVSNFLLWKSAYTELWFSDKFWPDSRAEDLALAVAAYKDRERRYAEAT